MTKRKWLIALLLVLVTGFMLRKGYKRLKKYQRGLRQERQLVGAQKILDLNTPRSELKRLYHSIPCLNEGENCFVYYSDNPQSFHSKLGFASSKSANIRHIFRLDNKISYDVHYITDPFGRRQSYQSQLPKEKFAAFFGCSFTYGIGVAEDQTIPSLVAKQRPSYEAFNYGVPGIGTNSVLGMSEFFPLKEQIPYKEGVFIYVFFQRHLERAQAHIPFVEALKMTPAFDPESLNYLGSIEDAYPIRTLGLTWLERIIGLNKIFPALDKDDIDYVCRLIQRTQQNLNRSHPQARFITYLHPSLHEKSADELFNCLDQKQIETLKSSVATNDEHSIEGDGHPSAKLNQEIATELITKLGL